MPDFFFDTYALLAVLQGEPAYEPFRRTPVFTHDLCLYELFTAILREKPDADPLAAVDALRPNRLPHSLGDLVEASAYKLSRSKDRVSYADSLGYVLARGHGLRFLTGDEKFEGVENVAWLPVRPGRGRT